MGETAHMADAQDKAEQEIQASSDMSYPETETLIGNWSGHFSYAEGSTVTSHDDISGQYVTDGISTDPIDLDLNFERKSDGTLMVAFTM